MLTILDRRAGTNRREFLRVKASAFGGLGLSTLFSAKAVASSSKAMRDRSVVVLNLEGGPTQFETFDPKMTAPHEIRSITGEVGTALQGVTFGGTMPRLAALADRTAIVRSYRYH